MFDDLSSNPISSKNAKVLFSIVSVLSNGSLIEFNNISFDSKILLFLSFYYSIFILSFLSSIILFSFCSFFSPFSLSLFKKSFKSSFSLLSISISSIFSSYKDNNSFPSKFIFLIDLSENCNPFFEISSLLLFTLIYFFKYFFNSIRCTCFRTLIVKSI